MKIPDSVDLQPKFFGNYFCLIPGTQLAFVAISKNGVTFLKKVAFYNATRQWMESFDEAHNCIGYTSSSPFLIPVSKIKAHEEANGRLIKFAVWRDPVQRVISTYKLFCLEKEYRTYFHFLDLQENPSFDRFMEFLEFEWAKKSPLNQDEHIRRQVDYYHRSDVDYVIPIQRICDFLAERNVLLKKERSNSTKQGFSIKNKTYLDKIHEYYREDYAIVCNY